MPIAPPDKVTQQHLDDMKANYQFLWATTPPSCTVVISDIASGIPFYTEKFEGADHEMKVLAIAVLHALKADRPKTVADQMSAKDRKIAALEKALAEKGINADGVKVPRKYNKQPKPGEEEIEEVHSKVEVE